MKEILHFCRMRPGFAIVGCGRIAQRHAEQIVKVGYLKAVCDVDRVKADEMADKFGAKSYYTLSDLLANEKEIEIVSVCTPNGLHAAQSIACLQSGKHVLCEKPLSISVEDANKMIEAANQSGKNLFVVKQNRYNPPVAALKKLLRENKLGKILSFQINCFWNRPEAYYQDNWRGTIKLDGGTLYTQFSHFIDLLYWLLGEVKNVKATIKNLHHPYNEIEDSGMVIFEMKNDAIGTMNYTVNSYQKNMEGSFTIMGEKGSLKIGGQYLNTMEYQCLEGKNIQTNITANIANDYGFYQGSMSNHDIVYKELITALQNPAHDFAHAIDGLKTVEIIEKIYHAAGFN